jgi:hypothetical protein
MQLHKSVQIGYIYKKLLLNIRLLCGRDENRSRRRREEILSGAMILSAASCEVSQIPFPSLDGRGRRGGVKRCASLPPALPPACRQAGIKGEERIR